MTNARIRSISLIFLLIILIFCASLGLSSPVREVKATLSTLVPIHTALGFSTILEFSTKPVSAVLGDQDAFKLEYIGNSITLKPLVAGAKSNLFVFLDSGRFSFSIQSGHSEQVDYIVKIKAADDSGFVQAKHNDGFTEIPINRGTLKNGFNLEIKKVKIQNDLSQSSPIMIDLELSSRKETYLFQASSLGLKQSTQFQTIENIYLDSLTLAPGASIHGIITVMSGTLQRGKPISIVFAIPSKKAKGKTERLEVFFNPFTKPVSKKEENNGKIELFPTVHPKKSI